MFTVDNRHESNCCTERVPVLGNNTYDVRELACPQPVLPDNKHMNMLDCKSSIDLDKVQEVCKHVCFHPSPPSPPTSKKLKLRM